MNSRFFAALILVPLLFIQGTHAQTSPHPSATPGQFRKIPFRPVDLDHQKTLYVVGYAHLDTQWRWAYPQVIREFIRNTMEKNFSLFEKYPNYTFNFTGSRRYEFMKEYYPADFARLKQYVAAGRWFPAGASVDETDALVSGLESRVRQVLYGNQFFEREFHKSSDEMMLPDCFGFPECLPSILAHCGIKGFSTQKLTWGSAVGIPFNLGVWEGVDGQSVVAALNPGTYIGTVNSDLSKDRRWIARVQKDGDASGVYADFRYYGTGDRGGAPDENSVKWMETSLSGTGPLRIVSGPANRLFDDLTAREKARLPLYKGELLLTNHSTGSLTSKAIMKHFNRENELLANAAESAATAAKALGALPYPSDKLYRAWDLVLGSQMHDMLPGTCIPRAYDFTWNDEVLALNQFASVVEASSAAVAARMDTRVAPGAVPIVVYNPLSIARQDVVQATIPLRADEPVTVYGPDGRTAPTQILSRDGNHATILFLASAPPVGYVAYEARAGAAPATASTLRVDESGLENERYRVTLNKDGDVESIFDKTAHRELLQSPAQLVFLHEKPEVYAAWNMDWRDRQKPPEAVVAGPAQVSVVESGPVRVALQIKRTARGSTFTQQIRLASGAAGNRVDFATEIDWRSLECSLKASFPLAVSNPIATYDAQLGTVQRGNNNPKKFEVPQHQWMDLTGTAGDYGVSILNDSKYGSDKPDDRTMRLTLLYSPGVWGDDYADQKTQDFGRHRMLYAVEGHTGDWRSGNTCWEAARLNQPLIAFIARPHRSSLGKTFSLFSTNSSQVQIVSIKKAEDGDEIIVRVRELSDRPAHGIRLSSSLRLTGAREVNGQEMMLGPETVHSGALTFDMTPYQLRAFALRLPASRTSGIARLTSEPIPLPFDLDAVTSRSNLADANFDGQGHTYPAEQFPAAITSEGVAFRLGSAADGHKNALTCRGQSIDLPRGPHNRIYLLAAAVNGDQRGELKIGEARLPFIVQDWSQFIGQWDERLWHGKVPELTYQWTNALDGLVPGYIKRAPVAWYCSHRHCKGQGDEFYQYAYLFKYGFDLPPGARTIVLPDNPKIRVFAISVAHEPGAGTTAAAPLYDTFQDHVAGGAPEGAPAPGTFADSVSVAIQPPLYYKEGDLHYTTDGSMPTAASPTYTAPLTLFHDTELKACEIDGTSPGPPWSGDYQVTDVSPPSVLSLAAAAYGRQITITYSKPVNVSSGGAAAHYVLAIKTGTTPPPRIESVELSADERTATLHLDAPLPETDAATLSVNNIVEDSPRANVLKSYEGSIDGLAPVFQVAKLDSPRETRSELNDRLPVQPGQPWTLNLFIRADAIPQNQSLLGGWGHQVDGRTGTGRYFVYYREGVAFWIANEHIRTNIKLDPRRWYMLTATYDGRTIFIYVNGVQVASGGRVLSLDDQVVGLGIPDPWGHGYKLHGEIRDFKIWNSTITPEGVKILYRGLPLN